MKRTPSYAIPPGVFRLAVITLGLICISLHISSAEAAGTFRNVDPSEAESVGADPAPVKPMIVAGQNHVAVVKSDGTVWTWGGNRSGQLGNSSTTNQLTPVQVKGMTGVTALAAGSNHTVALKSDGTVWSWGANVYGILGSGTSTESSMPVQAKGLDGVTAITAGFNHTVALKSDGTVWYWGRVWTGEFDEYFMAYKSVPVQIDGLTDVVSIGASGLAGWALKSDGTVWGWQPIDLEAITQRGGVTAVVALAGGFRHFIALTRDGTVWTWGENARGQCGDGDTKYRDTPFQVKGLTGVTAVDADSNMPEDNPTGRGHSMALKRDGTVWTWGDNQYGQLGNGASMNQLTPVQVVGIEGIVAIAAGGSCSAALGKDGRIWCWGSNKYGQLCNGTTKDSANPVQVKGLSE